MSDDSHLWTDWIKHDGKGCPHGLGAEVHTLLATPDGTFLEARGQISTSDTGRPSAWWEEDFGRPVRMNTQLMLMPRVLRYRVRRYAAASKMIAAAKASAASDSYRGQP